MRSSLTAALGLFETKRPPPLTKSLAGPNPSKLGGRVIPFMLENPHWRYAPTAIGKVNGAGGHDGWIALFKTRDDSFCITCCVFDDESIKAVILVAEIGGGSCYVTDDSVSL